MRFFFVVVVVKEYKKRIKKQKWSRVADTNKKESDLVEITNTTYCKTTNSRLGIQSNKKIMRIIIEMALHKEKISRKYQDEK